MMQLLHYLKDLNYGNYGILLFMGNAGFASSTVRAYDIGTWMLWDSSLSRRSPLLPGTPSAPAVLPLRSKACLGITSLLHHMHIISVCIYIYMIRSYWIR